MAGNPLIPQGTLNRLKASVVWPAFPQLNVTAPYLSRRAIRFAPDGDSTQFFPTMTGAVTSPEPFMMITATLHLLKSQQLAQLYKAQMETLALIGDGTIYPDVPQGPGVLSAYSVVNCAIQSVNEMSFAGDEPDYVVRIRGYYLINSSLWN